LPLPTVAIVGVRDSAEHDDSVKMVDSCGGDLAGSSARLGMMGDVGEAAPARVGGVSLLVCDSARGGGLASDTARGDGLSDRRAVACGSGGWSDAVSLAESDGSVAASVGVECFAAFAKRC